MRSMAPVSAFGLAVLGLLVALWGGTSSAQTPTVSPATPSPGFIAAALEHQEALNEGTLEVTYTYGQIDYPGPVDSYYYVRTPDILHMQQFTPEHQSLKVASYDRSTKEHRELTTLKGDSIGYTGSGRESVLMLLIQAQPDVARLPIMGGTISDAIRRGRR